jgi:RimJ/RimL family protein N-acetyltransferase
MAPDDSHIPPHPRVLDYGGWRWSLLLEEDPHAVTGSIDSPLVRRFLCWDGEADVRHAVNKRWRRDLAGESITLVARRDGAIAGWAGLLLEDRRRVALETSTFLHPTAWGTGLNTCAKHLQWTIAEELGHHRIVLDIAGDNVRSQASAWKHFPAARVLLLASPAEPEASLVLEVDEAPRPGRRPTPRQREVLARLLERHPAARVWRALAGG